MRRNSLALALCWGFLIDLAAAQTITPTQDLSFGRFVAGSGGSVAVGTTGSRSVGGGVVLVQSGGGSAATFQVSGTPSATYAITLPGNGVVTLVGPSGASMAVNNFVSLPASTGTLSVGGTQVLNVGATLSVGSDQQPGTYTGNFTVIVNHN